MTQLQWEGGAYAVVLGRQVASVRRVVGTRRAVVREIGSHPGPSPLRSLAVPATPSPTGSPSGGGGGCTVADHHLDRLAELGAEQVFGVPGDVTPTLLDHVVAHPWLVDELLATTATAANARAANPS